MAQVSFYKINNSQLSSLTKVEGQIIFVQDTGELYIDKNSTTRVKVSDDSGKIPVNPSSTSNLNIWIQTS